MNTYMHLIPGDAPDAGIGKRRERNGKTSARERGHTGDREIVPWCIFKEIRFQKGCRPEMPEEKILALYRITAGPEEKYPGSRFTPVGYPGGSTGEVCPAAQIGLQPAMKSMMRDLYGMKQFSEPDLKVSCKGNQPAGKKKNPPDCAVSQGNHVTGRQAGTETQTKKQRVNLLAGSFFLWTCRESLPFAVAACV